jgi:hypothetical protein
LIFPDLFGKMLFALKKRTVPDFMPLCRAEIRLTANFPQVGIKADGAGGKNKKLEENKCQ